MIINHNLPALNAYNRLSANNTGMAKSLEKLSSGLRINRAADDAAGLAISEKMRAQIRGLDQAVRNAQDGISLIQTAEGALSETHNILQRMRELSVQAANDTYTSEDRNMIQDEINQLVQEIDRIAATSQFNGKNLLDGTMSAVTSSSSLNVDVIMKGALRVVDQFGQKNVGGGNYNITVSGTSTGIAQVQKSNIFMIKHDDPNTTVNEIGMLATGGTKLYDIKQFWDANGNFILEEPQTITLVQGDGKTAQVMIYKNDTLSGLAAKISNAMVDSKIGLGQTGYGAVATNSVQIVTTGGAYTAGGHEVSMSSTSGNNTVAGTMLVSSAIAGSMGRITFVGDDAILNALGFAEVQKAKDISYKVVIKDAHTGQVINSGNITGNKIVGMVHENVDVTFNIKTTATYNAASGYSINSDNVKKASTSFSIHIADRTMVLHIGANQKQDIGAGLANMSAKALGVNNILVTNNALANEAIGKIDTAINKVSKERSKLGALQNRLNHTINNLTTASENMTTAESRIRDTDMAKEMMNFTKYNILSQAATAMLAQANTMPQSVLQLLR